MMASPGSGGQAAAGRRGRSDPLGTSRSTAREEGSVPSWPRRSAASPSGPSSRRCANCRRSTVVNIETCVAARSSQADDLDRARPADRRSRPGRRVFGGSRCRRKISATAASCQLARPARRVIDDQGEIGLRGGLDTAGDHVPGSEQVAQADAGPVVREGCSQACGGRTGGGHARHDDDLGRHLASRRELPNDAPHAVDAGVTAGDQRDGPALLG